MSRRVSLPGRQHFDGKRRADVALYLFEITHPALAAPIRLSTDMTEEVNRDPRLYGTRSEWRGADPRTEPFIFAPLQIEAPAEFEEAVPEARLIIGVVDQHLLDLLRSITSPAVCHFAKVLASQPSTIEEQCLGLSIRSAETDLSAGTTVELPMSVFPVHLEQFPAQRMTKTNAGAIKR
ncbi:hypothetical protein J4E08_10110 [Sagittula sp. NFXS13]|uniref:hypothetical protein n=1 Tax=Sagittula sp. NFXS13 TaxID=2819095 RepID=UPI0032DE63E3